MIKDFNEQLELLYQHQESIKAHNRDYINVSAFSLLSDIQVPKNQYGNMINKSIGHYRTRIEQIEKKKSRLNKIPEILSARQALKAYLKSENKKFKSVCIENGLIYITEWAYYFGSTELKDGIKHPRSIDTDRLTKFVKLVNDKAEVSVVNSEVIIKNK
jgi:hypothetical protein